MAIGQQTTSSQSISGQFGSTIGVYYTYTEVDPNIDSLTLSYSFTEGALEQSPDVELELIIVGTGAEGNYAYIETTGEVPEIPTNIEKKISGCRAAYTQAILNNFPQWMEMREKHTSVGHKLVQAWGCNLENTYEYYLDSRKDQFLSSADSYYDTTMAVSDLSFAEEKVYETDFRNLLYNSSFSMLGPKRYKKPDGWATSRDHLGAIRLSSEESLWGTHALVFDGSFGNAEIKQHREIALSSGRLNLSTYVKSPETGLSTEERWNADSAGIILVLRYTDDTVESYGIGFPKNTENKWVRASFSVGIRKEILNYEVIILNRTSLMYTVDLPQLEVNQVASNWTHSVSDTPVHSESRLRQIGGVQAVTRREDNSSIKKIEIFPLGSEEEFINIRIPTRIEKFSPKIDPKNSFNTVMGREINYFEEVIPIGWIVEDDKVLVKGTKLPDKFGKHLFADLYLDQAGDAYIDKTLVNSEQTKVKAITAYKGWLYAVAKENTGNEEHYYLKIGKPDKVLYEDNFLQSWGDIKLPIELGTSFGFDSASEEISRIGICKSIPNVIFIDTTLDRRFYFKLRYDYFYADIVNRKLYCREDYSAENGLLQVI